MGCTVHCSLFNAIIFQKNLRTLWGHKLRIIARSVILYIEYNNKKIESYLKWKALKVNSLFFPSKMLIWRKDIAEFYADFKFVEIGSTNFPKEKQEAKSYAKCRDYVFAFHFKWGPNFLFLFLYSKWQSSQPSTIHTHFLRTSLWHLNRHSEFGSQSACGKIIASTDLASLKFLRLRKCSELGLYF
jgi:hypothetical protein